jgi:EipB-like
MRTNVANLPAVPNGLSTRAKPAALATLAAVALTAVTAGQSHAVQLAPHRAIYDLTLAQTRGKSSVTAVRGRILYDFSGSACEGFTLQFRQVSELDSGEGKIALSDLRTSSWEDAAAKHYRFNSQNYLNNELVDQVDGKAERKPREVDVSLTKPQPKSFALDAAMVFPTEHMRRIIEAARAHKTILDFSVYDGAETGEKVYNTLTVIGRAIEPAAHKPDDVAAKEPSLAGMTRWPVTISYFDKSKKGGEQTPVYSISFEIYENGISRALTLDYGNFSVAGKMTGLELKTAKPCK